MNPEAIDSTLPKAHPFEAAGMDHGPYRHLGVYSIPSPHLAEANPDAYRNAQLAVPRLVAGLGTCACCGMAIVNVHIIRAGTGRLFGVGCDCVQKTGQKSLADAAKVAHARIVAEQRRKLAEARRRARHEAWLATVCNDRGETHAQRLARERAAEEAATRKRLELAARLEFLALALQDGKGGFRDSIAESLRFGRLPSGRALEIVRDIWGKQAGRSNSPAYLAAIQDLDTRLAAAEAA